MNPLDLTNLAQAGGYAGVLLFIVIAFLKGWIVPGFIYKAKCLEADDLREAVLKSNAAAKIALDLAARRKEDEARR